MGWPTGHLVDKTSTQPRRNLAAMLLVVVHQGVVAPQTPVALNLTGYAPQVTQSNAFQGQFIGKYQEVDRRTTQPRRNQAAAFQLLTSGQNPVSTQIPIATLNVLGYVPTVTQGSLILVGQDTHQDWDQPELFQPVRRDWVAYMASLPQGQGLNVPSGQIALTGYAPAVFLSGNVALPSGGLTITGFIPSVTRTSSQNQVDVQLGTLTLGGYSPFIQQSGGVLIGFGQLGLTGYSPVITQVAVPTYAAGPRYTIQRLTLRQFTVSAFTGPRFDAKLPIEQIFVTVDFGPDLATGETLVGGPAVTYSVLPNLGTIDPNPLAINNGAPGYDVSKTKAIVPIQGGLDGNDYLITVTVPTSTTGKTLSLAGILPVRAGTGV